MCDPNMEKQHQRERTGLSEEQSLYLSKLSITESDPGLLVRWDVTAVEAFVAAANGPGPLPPRPPYIQQPISTRSVIESLHFFKRGHAITISLGRRDCPSSLS